MAAVIRSGNYLLFSLYSPILSLLANNHWVPSLEVVHIQLVIQIKLRQLIVFFFYFMKKNLCYEQKNIPFIPYIHAFIV